jgi:hypothetical protein
MSSMGDTLMQFDAEEGNAILSILSIMSASFWRSGFDSIEDRFAPSG